MELNELMEASESPENRYSIDRDVEKVAASHHCSVVYPASDEIQLDIDSKKAYQEFIQRLRTLERSFQFAPFVSTPSKSGNGATHISLKAPGRVFTDAERVLLQSVLGSDPMRELLNTARYLRNGKSNTCLFEKKEEVTSDT